MNPPQKKQVLIHTVVEHDLFILCLTRIRRALLIGDQETPNKQSVVDRCTAQHATHLKSPARVISSDVEEFLSEVFGQEERSYRIAVLKVCARLEGETFLFGNRWRASISSWAKCLFARNFRSGIIDRLKRRRWYKRFVC
jgi:hypothetical protein